MKEHIQAYVKAFFIAQKSKVNTINTFSINCRYLSFQILNHGNPNL